MKNIILKYKILIPLAVFLLSSETVKAQQNVNIPEQATDISPLLIGEFVPEGNLQDLSGELVSLQKIVSAKPTVVIFYRGGWCPYCNLHLAELQGIEKDILEMGYQIVGISPDSPEKLKESVSKNKLNYSLYSDADLSMTSSFGLAFQAPEKYSDMLTTRSGGKNPGLLPVPGVFVIGTDGKILFEYINPNYNTRIRGNMLKAVLGTLK